MTMPRMMAQQHHQRDPDCPVQRSGSLARSGSMPPRARPRRSPCSLSCCSFLPCPVHPCSTAWPAPAMMTAANATDARACSSASTTLVESGRARARAALRRPLLRVCAQATKAVRMTMTTMTTQQPPSMPRADHACCRAIPTVAAGWRWVRRSALLQHVPLPMTMRALLPMLRAPTVLVRLERIRLER